MDFYNFHSINRYLGKNTKIEFDSRNKNTQRQYSGSNMSLRNYTGPGPSGIVQYESLRECILLGSSYYLFCVLFVLYNYV